MRARRTIEIDEFVPRTEIDDLYLIRPYYIAPDGKVGQDAFAVIRNVIRQMNMVAIGRVVLTSREHVIALEARGKGLMGTLLRYPYEVRDENEYFDDIQDVKLSKDMMDLAQHIVKTKTGHFEPEKFEDHYETALKELVEKKIRASRSKRRASAASLRRSSISWMRCAAAYAPSKRPVARKPPSADASGSRARRKCSSRSPARSPRRKWRGNLREPGADGRPDKSPSLDWLRFAHGTPRRR